MQELAFLKLLLRSCMHDVLARIQRVSLDREEVAVKSSVMKNNEDFPDLVDSKGVLQVKTSW